MEIIMNEQLVENYEELKTLLESISNLFTWKI